LNSA